MCGKVCHVQVSKMLIYRIIEYFNTFAKVSWTLHGVEGQKANVTLKEFYSQKELCPQGTPRLDQPLDLQASTTLVWSCSRLAEKEQIHDLSQKTEKRRLLFPNNP